MTPRRTDAAGRTRRFHMIMLRCRRLTRTAGLVVEHLHWLENRKATVATPSRAGMAAAIGRSERSVSRAVGELERAGLVAVWRDRPHCRRDGTWARTRTNLYRLKWPPRTAPPAHRPRSRRCDMGVPSMHSEAIEPERRRPRPRRRRPMMRQ